MSVGRPFGKPPVVISSNPAMPVRALESCRCVVLRGIPRQLNSRLHATSSMYGHRHCRASVGNRCHSELCACEKRVTSSASRVRLGSRHRVVRRIDRHRPERRRHRNAGQASHRAPRREPDVRSRLRHLSARQGANDRQSAVARDHGARRRAWPQLPARPAVGGRDHRRLFDPSAEDSSVRAASGAQRRKHAVASAVCDRGGRSGR